MSLIILKFLILNFYKIIIIENLDQRNNIIIYKKLNYIQFIFSKIVLTIIIIKDILYKRTLKKLENLIIQL